MQIFRMLFPLKCADCGQRIKGERFQGIGPGSICEVCHKRLEKRREWTPEKMAQQVINTINKDFLPEDTDEVHAILAEYGDAWYESDQEHMRLALLRLANGDKHALMSLVKEAKRDYRDILMEVDHVYGPDWLERYVNE